MENCNEVLGCEAEIIKDRFYFVTVQRDETPKSTQKYHYFTIDDELVYEKFCTDFGPLNLAMLYRYCCKVEKKLKSVAFRNKKIFHYTTFNHKARVNAAFLVGSYAIIYLKKTAEEVYECLTNHPNNQPYAMFCDASFSASCYKISLKDCLSAIEKCHRLGFFNFDDFNLEEYEYYERVGNGDLNWIVPEKFIAFCGPHDKLNNENDYPLHSPELYIPYFRRNNVKTIIRLNKKMYDESQFTKAGFDHEDLFFRDGSTPTNEILWKFLEISDSTNGAIAVHCKAGIGRTGTLIGCYIMKNYHLTAHETIAWIRICRPGSVIGHQQQWLENIEMYLRLLGDPLTTDANGNPPHARGIYAKSGRANSIIINDSKTIASTQNNVSGIVHRVDDMHLDVGLPTTSTFRQRRSQISTQNNVSGIVDRVDDMHLDIGLPTTSTLKQRRSQMKTQGDKLNEIKMRRQKSSILWPNGSATPYKTTTQRSGTIPNLGLLLQSRSQKSAITTLIGSKKDNNKSLFSRPITSAIERRSTRRVNANSKPRSTTEIQDDKTTTPNTSKAISVTKPVTRSNVCNDSFPFKTDSASCSTISATKNTNQQQSTTGMNMVLRSADRGSRYNSLKHARTTISSKTAFIR